MAFKFTERKVLGAVENYLENCAPTPKWILKPWRVQAMPEYILKYSTRGGSNIFQLFDTSEKKEHLVANSFAGEVAK